MKYVDYKEFIEENFELITKEGNRVPFIFNDTQNYAYSLLEADYPTFQGIRENWLKHRQWGGSTFITAMFATDFILSELGEMPIINADIYSHKDEETYGHYARFSLFFDSWLKRAYQTDNELDIQKLRKNHLKVDESGSMMVGLKETLMETKTASAKVSGRGGTKQNQLYTEIAFYPQTEKMNAKNLVVGATKQVLDGIGKIFKESTGNLSGDYFHTDYKQGKTGLSEYTSRFFGWYLHKEYTRLAPDGWEAPEYYAKLLSEGKADINQCYWHFIKTKGLTDLEELREYPTTDTEAFLVGGKPYFSKSSIIHYDSLASVPLYTGDDLIRNYAN